MLATAFAQVIYPARAMRTAEAVVLALTVTTAGAALIVALYLVKSALGINVMPGPSALHDLLYPLVRGY